MPWVKLTDDWYDDPLIVESGPLGLALWVTGLSWCARNLTDGWIPDGQVRRLLDWSGIALVNGMQGDDADPLIIAGWLVDLGLWRRVDAGYEVANYHRYQPARSSVLAERAKTAERVQRHRNAKRNAPSNGDVTPMYGRSTAPPVPVPVPTTTPSSSSDSGKPSPEAFDDDTEAILVLYADRKLASTNGAIKNPGPWKRKVLANARVELAGQARSWLDAFDVTASEVADALVAGQAGRSWTRRRQP